MPWDILKPDVTEAYGSLREMPCAEMRRPCKDWILMDTETENRLIALEMKLAYQERFLDELSGQIIAQGKQIAALEAEKAALYERLQDMAETLSYIPNTRPPHY